MGLLLDMETWERCGISSDGKTAWAVFKVKYNIYPSTGHESPGGIQIFLYSFSNLSARWDGWSNPHSDRFTPRKEAQYPLTGGWVGPRGCVDGCGKFRPYPGSNPGPSNAWRVTWIFGLT